MQVQSSSPQASILIVDDAPENLAVLSGILRDEYRVRVAINGEKALAIANSESPPDLILLDVLMPGMTGHEVCRQLKADPKTSSIPIIFVTALEDDQDEKTGFDLGAADYITKPVRSIVVKARIKTQLSLYQQERLLAQTNQELERATRLKDEFLANMSHELRTPLNAILGMAEGLQEEVFGSLNSKQKSALKTIENSGSHLLELINDILDLAKVEAGKLELEYVTTEVKPLCTQSLSFIKQQAHKKRIQVDLKIPDALPTLVVDERRTRQVIINLLTNAVKFTPEGGQITLEVIYPSPFTAVSPTVEVQQMPLAASSPFLRIAITDTGIGIPPDKAKQLFQPFVQIDSALNRQNVGTGLGLALVKRIVETHGGVVGLTSEEGKGSCFTIDLPCVTTSCLKVAPVPQTTAPEATDANLGVNKISILLADDNQANVDTLSSYLTAKGYEIRVAKNGQEAIEKARSEKPDLILMDIQMPVIDGFEATQKIRQYPDLASIPIIALTALAMKGDREKCLAAGANDYLSKPIKLKQLTATIQHLLSPKSPL